MFLVQKYYNNNTAATTTTNNNLVIGYAFIFFLVFNSLVGSSV